MNNPIYVSTGIFYINEKYILTSNKVGSTFLRDNSIRCSILKFNIKDSKICNFYFDNFPGGLPNFAESEKNISIMDKLDFVLYRNPFDRIKSSIFKEFIKYADNHQIYKNKFQFDKWLSEIFKTQKNIDYTTDVHFNSYLSYMYEISKNYSFKFKRIEYINELTNISPNWPIESIHNIANMTDYDIRVLCNSFLKIDIDTELDAFYNIERNIKI